MKRTGSTVWDDLTNEQQDLFQAEFEAWAMDVVRDGRICTLNGVSLAQQFFWRMVEHCDLEVRSIMVPMAVRSAKSGRVVLRHAPVWAVVSPEQAFEEAAFFLPFDHASSLAKKPSEDKLIQAVSTWVIYNLVRDS